MCEKDREKPLKWINQIKTTQQELFNITQNSQHSQYNLKQPYISLQATYLPQFNNSPQIERERERENLKQEEIDSCSGSV